MLMIPVIGGEDFGLRVPSLEGASTPQQDETTVVLTNRLQSMNKREECSQEDPISP